jgi:GMP synthase (glutamine-hydrolysing)
VREVVAIRHVAFEHLGAIAPLLTGRGLRIRYLDAGVSDLDSLDPLTPDLLVVLGGPIGAYEEDNYPYITQELRIIEHRLAAQRPLLGICLGAQLMARALGARVYPGKAKEIGWGPLRLTEEGQASCLAGLAACDYQVLHWHGDTFDLPQGARRLASTIITENQAFSHGGRALGLQFHLELDPNEIERWLLGHAHEIAATPDVTPAGLRAATVRHGPALAKAASACMGRWLLETGLMPAPPTDGALP